MKRIVFLSCRCASKTAETSYEDEEMDEEVIADEANTSPSLFYSINPRSVEAQTAKQPINTMLGYFHQFQTFNFNFILNQKILIRFMD